MKTYIIIKCESLSDQYECDAFRYIWFVGSKKECLNALDFYFKDHGIKDRYNPSYADYQRNFMNYELYECDGYNKKIIDTNYCL